MSEQSLTRDETLNDAEIADLRCIAGMIIPQSAKYRVPGADDDVIIADIVASIGRDGAQVRAALARLRTLAGGPFAALGETHRAEVAAKLRADGGGAVGVLTRIVLLCYYRDDRVMASLGWRHGRRFRGGTSSSRGTGRCSTRCGLASRSGAPRHRCGDVVPPTARPFARTERGPDPWVFATPPRSLRQSSGSSLHRGYGATGGN